MIRRRRTMLALGVLLAGYGLGIAQARPGPTDAVGSAPLVLAGLATEWSAAFARRGGRVRLTRPFGPPQGALDPNLGAFLDGRLDFAFLAREIAEADLARFRSRHRGEDPVMVPVAGGSWRRFGYVDAVVLIVHPSNPVRSLSFPQIDAIFSGSRWRGGREVRVWGDLGLEGAWRDEPIRVMGGGAWAGEESARALSVRRRVLSCGGNAGRWRPAPGTGDDQDVVARVAADPAAIGFTGMGHVSRAVRAVSIAAPGRRPVGPSRATAQSGQYPLLRTVDLLIDRQASPATIAFARYLLSRSGQAVIARQGDFMPLPSRERAAALKRLRQLSAQSATREPDREAGSCWTGEPA